MSNNRIAENAREKLAARQAEHEKRMDDIQADLISDAEVVSTLSPAEMATLLVKERNE